MSDPCEPFKSLDDLGSCEEDISEDWAEQCGEPRPTTPDSAANSMSCLEDCLSPGSAQKAMSAGAEMAMKQHMESERRASIRKEQKAINGEEEDDGEALWVRSQSGEHQMDARKSIYLQVRS